MVDRTEQAWIGGEERTIIPAKAMAGFQALSVLTPYAAVIVPPLRALYAKGSPDNWQIAEAVLGSLVRLNQAMPDDIMRLLSLLSGQADLADKLSVSEILPLLTAIIRLNNLGALLARAAATA